MIFIIVWSTNQEF